VPLERNTEWLDKVADRVAKKLQGNQGEGGLIVNIENFVNNRKQDVREFAEELERYRRQAAYARGDA